ncbi:MAG: indolepyruvate oxidoreductase subunit beta [Candidatus Stygibacter australis]|nr:indolepyruvate oxidoreductase subunit beta [Candidatus Stygibacter australis]MDP8321063.1 indolepyruvate oxidoreductase subunit beta [Candidatus Stygibacter australis]
MKQDIILAGVGGQGILTIAAIIGQAALDNGLNMKQAEVHGMSQRGGDVQSHLRISDAAIYSDLIAKGACDMIISVEPMEALRYKNYLSKDGWLISNSTPFKNIPNYPEMEDVEKEIKSLGNHVLLNADQIAKDLGSARAMNIVMLGAATKYLSIPYKSFEAALQTIFGRKGQKIVDMNVKALAAGRKFADEKL